MSDDIVVGSVAVDIVPNTTNLRRDLQAKVQGISVDIGVNADTTGIRAELDDVSRHRDATITANADVAEANAQLDITARDRTSTIRANVDQSQVSAIGKLSSGLGGISGFAVTLVALGPALIPILAVVGGLGLALAAPLAIAGGGATVFGFLAGFAVKDTAKQLKAIADQRKKLGELTKGTKEYADANADLKVLIGGLSPAQKKFSDALDHIKGSFAELLGGKTGGELLGPISAFLNLTADVLPKLEPIISAVSGALTDLLGDLGKAVQGPDFKNFIDAFSKQVGPDIEAFGHIAGGVFKGVAGLVVSLGDAFGPGLLKGIETLTDNFADFGQQAGNAQKLQDFIGYVKRIGPQVGDTIGAVARGIGHVVEALAPLGPPALKAIEGIANAISGIPIPVLTGMAAAFIAVAGAAKVGKGLSALGLLGGGGLGKSGGGGILGNLIGTAKPVPVFVTNPGFGGGIGGAVGGGKSSLGRNLLGLSIGVPIVGAAASTGFAHGEAEDRAFAEKWGQRAGETMAQAMLRSVLNDRDSAFVKKFGGQKTLPNDDILKFAGLTRDQARNLLSIPELKSTTNSFDSLKAHAQDASRTIDLIGPHADETFGKASKDVDRFSARLDAIHDKKIAVLLNDLAAVQSLKALQAFRLKDKTLTVHVEQELDRVVGPGGGIGHPLGASAGGGAGRNFTPSAAPRSGSGAGASGPLVSVDKVYARDLNDLLRESDKASRQRSGGGVILTGAPR